MSLLNVENLKTYYLTNRGPVKAVDDVSFKVREGEAMGLAGESGCGKTTVALSIMRILPSRGKIIGGKLLLKNLDLARIPEKQMKKIPSVFQESLQDQGF